MRSILIGLVVLTAATTSYADNVKVSGQAAVEGIAAWALDVVYEQPKQIVVQSADGTVSAYWYIIMSLTNKTGKEVGFYPDCDLMTDNYQILQAGAGVPNTVYQKIQTLYKERYPFLQPLEKSMGKMLPGEDQTKDVLVVWKDFDKDAHGIKLFVSGLSGETTSVTKPAVGGATAEEVILRKTLEFDYKVVGDADMRTDASLLYKGKQWVMR
jgi:hypothetical protein